MAFTTTSSAPKAATVLLLIIAASTVSQVSASTMWAYENRGCGGNVTSWICGCRNLTGFKGGFFFYYAGGWKGTFYHGLGCKGSYVTIGRHFRHCIKAHPINSVFIPCTKLAALSRLQAF